MTYEKHLESIEKRREAEANGEAARQLWQEAEEAQQKALSNYQEILEQGKAEDNMELRKEAFAEYEQFLQSEAARAKDYQSATLIYKNLADLKMEWEQNKAVWAETEKPPFWEILEEVRRILDKQKITDQAIREHALNSAQRLAEEGHREEFILQEVQKRITDRPYKKAIADWAGHH